MAVWRGEPRTENAFFSMGRGVVSVCHVLIFWRFASRVPCPVPPIACHCTRACPVCRARALFTRPVCVRAYLLHPPKRVFKDTKAPLNRALYLSRSLFVQILFNKKTVLTYSKPNKLKKSKKK